MTEDLVDKCNICKPWRKYKVFKINPTSVDKVFKQIGIDIIGPLPKTYNGRKYIITATDYSTRWCEAKAIKNKSSKEVVKFLLSNIFYRHGPPKIIKAD